MEAGDTVVVIIIPWGHLNLTSNRVQASQRGKKAFTVYCKFGSDWFRFVYKLTSVCNGLFYFSLIRLGLKLFIIEPINFLVFRKIKSSQIFYSIVYVS